MRPARFVALIYLFGSASLQTGCSSAPDLTGTWAWEYNQDLSGSRTTLLLQESSSTVTGTAFLTGIGPYPVVDTLSITGSRLGGSFSLRLTAPSGPSIEYTGQLVGHDELRGTWIEVPATTGGTVIFYRQ